MTVYIFPVLVIAGIIAWFFFSVFKGGGKLPRPDKAFEIPPRGRLSKKDIAPMIVITVIYAAIALFYLGETKAPQTFWRAWQGDVAEVDFGEPVILSGAVFYVGDFRPYSYNDITDLSVTIYLSEDGIEYSENEHRLAYTFSWKMAGATTLPTRYARIEANAPMSEIGEFYFLTIGADGVERRVSPVSVTPPEAAAMFDEPVFEPPYVTPLKVSVFDEFYHARAAIEFMRGDDFINDVSHPPLGKEIIWAGMELFGMTPFGWRIMGVIFGILMMPLFYLLMKQLFNSSAAAAGATAVWAADFLHFAQTRLATVDTYNVFFVLFALIFMHRWMTLPDDMPLRKTLLPLCLCGLSFGVGFACKWSVAYIGPFLIAMYVWKLVLRSRRSPKGARAGFIFGTLAFSLLSFVIVPFGIYILTYIPYVFDKPVTLKAVWDAMYENQSFMLYAHTNEASTGSTHQYSSSWYHWLINFRPLYFYLYSFEDRVSAIFCFNNPALAWGGLIALMVCAVDAVRNRLFQPLFIGLAYVSMMLPWVFIARYTFIYHYFPPSMMLAAAFGYMFWRLYHTHGAKPAKQRITMFVLGCALLFTMFYSILVGIPVSIHTFSDRLLWLPSWHSNYAQHDFFQSEEEIDGFLVATE